MRILHVCRQYRPGVGGLEAFLDRLTAAQRDAGHQVRVVTLNRIFSRGDRRAPRREVLDGVEVIRIPYLGSRRYPIAPTVLAHLDNAEIVHVHALDFLADYLALTRPLHRKPLVLSTHGGFFHTDRSRRLKRLWFGTITRASLRRYRAVIGCSDQDTRLFAPLCAHKLVTVQNGVQLDKFPVRPRREGRVLLSYGRIAPNKQPDLLIRWFAAVQRFDPSWHLVIAGPPMGIEPRYLEQLVREHELEEAVTLAFSPSDEELEELVAASAIFISASRHEGFGLAAVEAASAGLGLVLSDIPAHRETQERLGCGLLLDFEAADAPARFLRQIDTARATPPDLAERLQGYGWQHASAAIEQVYHRVLRRDRRTIGPVAVEVMDEAEALARVTGAIRRRDPQVVAFCNAHVVNLARADPDYASVLAGATVLNDGVGVDIASRLCHGAAFPANLNGTDFVPALLAGQRRLRLYLVGGAPGIAAEAGRMLAKRYPGVRIVGAEHGYFDEAEEAALAARIAAARADLVLAAMGNPKQEFWAARWAGTIGAPVLCVGALFDFLSGTVRRAPPSVRRMRLEWAYRLLQEPGRLAERYLVGNLRFLLGALGDARRGPALCPGRPAVRAAEPALDTLNAA